MRKLSLFFIVIIILLSCASQKLMRISNPAGITGPPVIKSLVDLGSLPPAPGGEINQEMMDGRYTPGEWVAVMGKNLASPDTRVYFDGTEAALAGYLEGGSILVRVPRGLTPYEVHNLIVNTSMGKAEVPLVITGYLIVNNPFSEKMIFYRSLCAQQQFFEEDEAAELPAHDNLCQVISPSGGLLYLVNSGGLIRKEYELKVIHLGEGKGPAEISSIYFQFDSKPAAIDISSKEDVLVVLAEKHLYIFDLSNPAAPALSGKINLPFSKKAIGSGYRSAAILDHGRYAAALEPSTNSIALVDISARSNPWIVQNFEVAPGSDLPLSIEISADMDDPESLWLLQGPNIRYAYKGIQELLSLGGNAEKQKNNNKESIINSRVTRLKIKKDLLKVSEQTQLPSGFIPLFMKSFSGKKALVSGISVEFFRFTAPSLSLDGIVRLLGWLRDTVELGRIISVTGSGEVSTEAQGLSIFLCLDRIAKDGPLVYSVMKLGPRYIPPSVGADIGVEVGGYQYFYFEKLDTDSLYPPYRAPMVIVQ